MQILLMTFMIINSVMFTQMKHPMTMGMTLLIQTIFITLYTGMLSKSFWFSYILFLIFIGGMLILFIYMSSLSPNKKIMMSMNFLMYLNFPMILMTIFFDKFFISLQIKEKSLMINQMDLMNENLLMLSKMYDLPNNFITIMMISYLLLTLIVVVKITNSFLGPLRMKN